jgi:C1A family cysteine protease
MKLSSFLRSSVCFHLSFVIFAAPTAFDLRSVDGQSFVSSVKRQNGGTCWTHGTMAALESNLLMTHEWKINDESGDANLAEYHLDWWNGFNEHFNADITPTQSGLTVHQGGDYRVATAYLSRGGAVRDVDGQSYSSAPKFKVDTYHTYYVRDVEWLTAGKKNENIEAVKKAIMDGGVIGTALAWDDEFYSDSKNTFYQPESSDEMPNHAVAIVGWDDNKVTQAPQKGAWLVKNSWGTSFGEDGFFWISYYDKTSGHHPQMGAVSFKNVERLKYDKIYTLDYHGWRDTKAGVTDAFNAFTAEGGTTGKENLKSVSFYSAAENVTYLVSVYKTFENGQLKDLVSMAQGGFEQSGFHTVNLDNSVELQKGDKFYVQVNLSHGGQAYDKTSDVPVLLGGGSRTIVKSNAKAGESFYLSNGTWVDLTQDDKSANFCIKALTTYL